MSSSNQLDVPEGATPTQQPPSPSGSSSWFAKLRSASVSPGPLQDSTLSLDLPLPEAFLEKRVLATDLLPKLPEIPLKDESSKDQIEEIRQMSDLLGRLSDREIERAMEIEETAKVTDLLPSTCKSLETAEKQKLELIRQLELHNSQVWKADIGENVGIVGGRNKRGALNVILRAGRYKIHSQSKPAVVFAGEQTMAYIDSMISSAPKDLPSLDKVCAIVDFRGFLPTPSHLPFAIWLLQSGVAQLYNSRIDAIYIYESPLLVEGFWKIFKTMVPKSLTDFLTFIDRKRILEHFDIDEIPPDMGGAKPYDTFVTIQHLAVHQLSKLEPDIESPIPIKAETLKRPHSSTPASSEPARKKSKGESELKQEIALSVTDDLGVD